MKGGIKMKNKYTKILVLFVVTLLTLSLVSAGALNSGKAKEPLDKITFIHYKDGTVKEVGFGKVASADRCYKLLGIKWNSLPVSYVIDPTSSGMSSDNAVNAITASANAWDEATSRQIYNGYSVGSATWDDGTTNPVDRLNEYVFGVYPDPNVIAVTNTWYTRYGRQIVDYDVLFNTFYAWGDANVDSSVMDLQNIATHETGHGLGLADIYNSACSAVTMYGYASVGETMKRDLAQPDIIGLQKMYGV